MKLAVFDLDGTLINSMADIADATNHAMRTLGFPTYPLEAFNMMIGDGLKNLIERALPNDKQEYYEQALSLYKDYYNKHYTVKTYVYDGIRELLDTLSENGVTLAVASNKTHEFTESIVKYYFGDNLFSVVYGKSDGRPVKPDPAILFAVMDKLGAKPQETFMIGDTSMDINTGKNAETKTIGCLWGFRTLQELSDAKADFIAQNPSDILEFIL